jgi:translation initiation factor IF-3
MIRAPEVRLVGDDGKQIGVVPTDQARSVAEERGLDLVEVAPDATPPVCKLIDYGKFRYQQARRARDARRRHHHVGVKEMRLRPKTDKHDLDFKMKKVREFLEQHHKVRVVMRFRGREQAYTDRGLNVLKDVADQLSDVATVEQSPKVEGRLMVMFLAPKG